MSFPAYFKNMFSFIIIKVVYNHQFAIIVMQLSSYNKISSCKFS